MSAHVAVRRTSPSDCQLTILYFLSQSLRSPLQSLSLHALTAQKTSLLWQQRKALDSAHGESARLSDLKADEGHDEADEHAHLLADAVLDLVEVLRHLAGKVGGRVGVVPPDVLAEHCPQELQKREGEIVTLLLLLPDLFKITSKSNNV